MDVHHAVAAAPPIADPIPAAVAVPGRGEEGRHLRVRGSSARRLARSLRTPPLPAVFLVLGLGFGMLVALFTPPGQALDETNHFFRAWQVSSGHLLAPLTPDPTKGGLERAGGEVPDCVAAYMDYFNGVAASPRPFSVSDYFATPSPCRAGATRLEYFENTATNSSLSYLPQAVGIDLGRAVYHLPGVPRDVWIPFFLGRFAGLAMYVSLVYAALRIARRGRLVIFVLACLPMSLQLAASFNGDGMLLGVTFLLAAAALRLIEEGSAPWRWVAPLAVGAALVGLLKPVDLPLAAVAIAVPVLWDPTNRRRLLAVIGAIVGGSAVALLWRQMTANVNVKAYFPQSDTAAQLALVEHHPGHFVLVLEHTLTSFGFGEFTMPTTIAAFGMFRTGVPTWHPAPTWTMTFLGLLTLAAAVLAEYTGLREHLRRRSIVLAAVAVVSMATAFVLVYLAAYLAWTPVGADEVGALPGRYFEPQLAFLAVPAVLLFHGRELRRRSWVAVGVSAALLVYASAALSSLFF